MLGAGLGLLGVGAVLGVVEELKPVNLLVATAHVPTA